MSNLIWLSIFRGPRQTILEEHKHVYDLCLPRSGTALSQRPSLITFIGKSFKSKCIRQLFVAAGEVVPWEPHGQIRLWSHPSFRTQSKAMLIADCELHNLMSSQTRPTLSDGLRVERKIPHTGLTSESEIQANLGFKVYRHTLLPFSNIVCIFADDFASVEHLTEVIVQGLIGPLPVPDLHARPRLLIFTTSHIDVNSTVTSKLVSRITNRISTVHNLTLEESFLRLQNVFHAVHVIRLDGHGATADRMLSRSLEVHITATDQNKRTSKLCFTYLHLQAFWNISLDRISQGNKIPLDLILAARTQLVDPCSLSDHTSNLLLVSPRGSLHNLVCPLLASALILHSVPPGMHFFQGSVLFDKLYSQHLYDSIARHVHGDVTPQHFVRSVKTCYLKLYREVEMGENNAVSIHQRELRLLQSKLSMIKSNRSCFCCCLQTPEKVLSCGHALCDMCIYCFGFQSTSSKHCINLAECPLCGTSNTSYAYHFMPITAAPRLLSLDGGGIKAITTLVFLQHLQAHFNDLEISIRDLFDIVIGTSSGGVIALGLFIMRWSPKQCLQQFESLSQKSFGRRPGVFLSRALDYILSIVTDSKYNSHTIEYAFKAAFGTDLSMFNPLSSHTKVAVTTTTVKDSIPCLFANYNGDLRSQEAGYHIIRAIDPEYDVSVDNAARCTSAAPYYFESKSLPKLGSYQDGGILNNCPAGLVLKEAKALYPRNGEPDFILSLGTGMTKPKSPLLGASLSPVRKRFPFRLFSSFMATLDSERAWKETVRSISPGSRTKCHRFNMPFKNAEPELDDVSCIETLKEDAEIYFRTEASLRPLLDSFWASLFYFELDSRPRYSGGYYYCTGLISCRQSLTKQGTRLFYHLLIQTNSYFVVDGRPVVCVDPARKNITSTHPLPFSCPVEFAVKSLDDSIGISLTGITMAPQYLSGLPRTVKTFVDLQRLESFFGRSDHKDIHAVMPQGKKRKRSF